MPQRPPNRIGVQRPAQPRIGQSVTRDGPLTPVQTFDTLGNFTRQAASTLAPQLGGVPGVAIGQQPSPPAPLPPSPSAADLGGDVFGPPDATVLQAIQGQAINGALADGEAYIGSGGELLPVAVVQPFSGTPASGDRLAWNGSAWVPVAAGTGQGNASWAAQSTSFTISAATPFVLCDTTGGNIVSTLPQASAYLLGDFPALTVKIAGGGHNVSFTAHAGDDIDGSASITITNIYDTLTVVVRADGTGWGTMHPQP